MNYFLLFGDFECLKAAVQNGANSVYLGASSFSARAKATNFNNTELFEAIKYAKLRNVEVHLALNTLIKNDEFEDAVNLALNSYNLGVDAIIIQDLGLASYLLKNYPQIPLHASTQMTVHNLDGVKQLKRLGFSRVVLARELSLDEIKYIRENETDIELEVFIHGALCISYSGQCLLSSMIGGRSGNRGLCAQPCRLPYELLEKNKNTNQISSLDNGYLLSPRDNCGIEFLPELIKLGINSLKIEGRMKTPTYVGVVTRIYRKYIDLIQNNIELDNNTLKNIISQNLNIKNPDTGLSDKEELTQVFNRGGFSTGHFKPSENKNLIFKDKPNNMGIYVGTISNVNENKGLLTLKLENSLSIGDKVSINNESYNVSELIINNKNFETLEYGTIAKIGRMRGKIFIGSKIYRIETSKLNKSISPSFKEDKNFKKIPLDGEIIINENNPISLKIKSSEGFYKNLEFTATSSVYPQKALKAPITAEKVTEQILKTGNTEFEFKNLKVNLDNNLFIQMSILNDLRRTAIQGLENLVIKETSHNLSNENLTIGKKENLNITANNLSRNMNLEIPSPIYNPNISLLLNTLNIDYNYSKLTEINRLYIPLKYFLDSTFTNLLLEMSNIFNIYIYLPNILKISKLKNINFESILSKFKIRGFVISHISQLEKVSNYNLDLIGNFTLNIYNNVSIETLKTFNLCCFTPSPELNKFEINELLNYSPIPTEIIVYGKLPVMTNNYCYLGKANKCYKECDKKCNNNSLFYLNDRMNIKFRIIPDNTSTLTTIYNSKTLSIKYNDINTSNIRIDILDENFEEIENIIKTVKEGKRFEGKDYTNGKY